MSHDRPAAQPTASRPEPLGVTLSGNGVNVAVVSSSAECVEICLFSGGMERRVSLRERTGDVWHGHVAGVATGATYGLRAHGPWDPLRGHRFNSAKLLIDPHAVSLDRVCRLDPAMFGHRADAPDVPDPTDSAGCLPLGVVTGPGAGPEVVRPDRPWSETIIYELHVRGFTRRHPDIPEALRGTFAGLGHPAAIAHLTRLGVTCVEVMPSAAWIEERHLAALGLSNYWGYNSIAFGAPDPRLAPGGWTEVRAAVAALAAAGIETIVDMVLNHSGEGDALGPTLSLRGLDNALYYRLRNDGSYIDDTGCGNTLALDRPHVVRLAMDALRAWVERGGVHGFRFDLASVLGRRRDGFDPEAPLLTAISQDPLLRGCKLIAEPWDVGWGGYRLGQFPGQWGEWNDRFRDDVRRFWRGDGGPGPLASRLAGSSDLLGSHRRPSRGISFVAAHDGFTLQDLVSYEKKCNKSNGEANRDGRDDNLSWNNGVEGASDDTGIQAARRADQLALLATLLVARGTPMLSMGSELGHTQHGNNNAYCQDNELSWLNWSSCDRHILEGTRRLIAARRALPALRDDQFPSGLGTPPCVAWRRADGGAMTLDDWNATTAVTLVMVFASAGMRVAVAVHRGLEKQTIALPDGRWRDWLADTSVDQSTEVSARSVTIYSEV